MSVQVFGQSDQAPFPHAFRIIRYGIIHFFTVNVYIRLAASQVGLDLHTVSIFPTMILFRVARNTFFSLIMIRSVYSIKQAQEKQPYFVRSCIFPTLFLAFISAFVDVIFNIPDSKDLNQTAVWSGVSVFAQDPGLGLQDNIMSKGNGQQRGKTVSSITCAPFEDSIQPTHPHSLIRVFIIRMKKKILCILCYTKWTQQSLITGWSDSSLRTHVRRYTFWRFGSNGLLSLLNTNDTCIHHPGQPQSANLSTNP